MVYKFGHLAQREWQTMYDLAKMFLHCLNHWKLETPTSRQQHAGTEDMQTYKVNYTRCPSSINSFKIGVQSSLRIFLCSYQAKAEETNASSTPVPPYVIHV